MLLERRAPQGDQVHDRKNLRLLEITLFLRAVIALLLPSRFRLLRLWLAAPYVKHLTNRRSGPLLAPYLALLDAVEVLAVVRGGLRNRILVL